ncbi:MAG: hypothetical protein H6Q71_1 [Firmicutes bacterium]|nr:hypothetical protein [Bacillota bacterium]
MENIYDMLSFALEARKAGTRQREYDHYYALRYAATCKEEIKRLLPLKEQGAFDQMVSDLELTYSVEKELVYRQGFTDALRLVFDLLWDQEEDRGKTKP